MGKKKKKRSVTIGHADKTSGATNGKPAANDVNLYCYPVAQLLDKADEYVNSLDYDLARRFCQRAVDAEHENIRAVEMLGFVELQCGNYEQARHLYGRAIELQPEVGHSKYMYMGQITVGHESVKYFLAGIELMKKSLESITSVRDDSDSEAMGGCDTTVKEVTARDLSSAYCSVAEIYLTDACDDEDAEVRCKENLDFAVAADPSNAEAYHTLASYWLCKGDRQSAVSAMEHGLSLWLPQLRNCNKSPIASAEDSSEVCAVSYPARISCAKMLIELENFDVASEILEFLLDESDEVVEVWYLLGLLNYLRGSDFKYNARHYLKKGLQLAEKLLFEDVEILDQMKELMAELGPGDENSENDDDVDMDDEMNGEDVIESDMSDDDTQAASHRQDLSTTE